MYFRYDIDILDVDVGVDIDEAAMVVLKVCFKVCCFLKFLKMFCFVPSDTVYLEQMWV